MADKIKVFIVDDNVMARKMMIGVLSKDPSFEMVGEAGTGQGGIIMLEEALPDVLLLEAAVSGGMTLEEVLTQVKALSPETKVVLCIEDSTHDMVIIGEKNGIVDFISKPCRPNELIRIVKEAHHES